MDSIYCVEMHRAVFAEKIVLPFLASLLSGY
jgi:hypothetical protein